VERQYAGAVSRAVAALSRDFGPTLLGLMGAPDASGGSVAYRLQPLTGYLEVQLDDMARGAHPAVLRRAGRELWSASASALLSRLQDAAAGGGAGGGGGVGASPSSSVELESVAPRVKLAGATAAHLAGFFADRAGLGGHEPEAARKLRNLVALYVHCEGGGGNDRSVSL